MTPSSRVKHIRGTVALVLSILLVIPAFFSFGIFSSASEIRDELPASKDAATQKDVISVADVSLTTAQLAAELAKESKIFHYVDREAFESAGHIERLVEKEELNSFVFRNADGSNTIYIMEENVKYIDNTGAVREKDLTLTQNSKGAYTVKNDVELSFPVRVSDGVSLTYKGDTVTLTPYIDQQKITSESVRLNDGVIRYNKAFGDGASLQYKATLSGVKEDIVLESYQGVSSFQFVLKTGSLSVFETDGNYYIASSESSDKRINIGNVVAYDRKGSFSLGSLIVKETAETGKYILTVEVDDTFLQSAKTVYPVFIDPSFSVADITGTGSIEDAVIFAGVPKSNFGGMQYNSMGKTEYGIAKTVVRLPGLYNSNLYKTVYTSQLLSVNFHVREASGNAAQTVSLYPVDNVWTESTVTWNNLGSYSDTSYCSVSLKSSQWGSFDITDLAQEWKEGIRDEKTGFILVSGSSTANKQFCSSEFSANSNYRPYVTVNYTAVVMINASPRITMCTSGNGLQLTAETHPSDLPVTWHSDDESVATVSDSGFVTGVGFGMARITATATTDDHKEYTSAAVKIYVKEDPWGNGIGESASTFIQGAKTAVGENENYLQPEYFDSTAENNSMVCDSIEADLPSFRIEYHQTSNYGYYTIFSLDANKYIGVDVNAASGDAVTLYSSNNTIGTRWAIIKIADDRFKIVSLCSGESELVLKGSGNSVIIAEYTDDNDYKDEWVLFERFDFIFDDTFLDFYMGYRDRILRSFEGIEKKHTICFIKKITKEQLLEHIKYSNVILFAGHGRYEGLQLNGANDSLTISDLEQLDNNYFENTQLVILASCECGRGVVNGMPVSDDSGDGSFADTLQKKGVQTVVAFNFSIIKENLMKWCRQFFMAIFDRGNNNASTIQEAIDYACDNTNNWNKNQGDNGVSLDDEYMKCLYFGSNDIPDGMRRS